MSTPTAWTAGPWQVGVRGDGGFAIDGPNGQRLASMTYARHDVASTVPNDEREANARLIAQPGALQVFCARAGTDDWDLFHLSDWVVSSTASGPSVILVPRERVVSA